MTDEQKLRAMAAWIREHGFTPEAKRPKGCGCFITAAMIIDHQHYFLPQNLYAVVGAGMGADHLRAAGWDEGATDDAAAACEIAADLCAGER